jgi:hypothetical protein
MKNCCEAMNKNPSEIRKALNQLKKGHNINLWKISKEVIDNLL